MLPEQLVEEGGRAPKQRQRRRGHAIGLVREQVREARGAFLVDLDLAAREAQGVDGEHGAE